jgi:cytochrome c oxidase subunit 2
MNGSMTIVLASWFMPEQGSTFADGVDWLWGLLLLITAFFTVLIMGLLLYFVIKNRQRTKADRAHYAKGITHSTPLEMTWVVVPTVVVIAIFVMGFNMFLGMTQPPSNAYEILVIANQWNWTFQYPNGKTSSVLHVPADTPVKLQLQSNDVIHSFYVPAFRIKKDLVPGRYNKVWFNASWDGDTAEPLSKVVSAAPEGMGDFKTNVYDLYCAEYCGTGHSTMLSRVIVHEQQADFEEWVNNQKPGTTPVKYGKQVFDQYCSQCHMAEGVGQSIGPPWDGKYGTTVQFVDAQPETFDDDYIRESILFPQRKIVQGYQDAGNMPTFKGLLNDYQIFAIIQYMKSLSDQGEPLENFDPVEASQ